MNRTIRNLLLASPAILGMTAALSVPAVATEISTTSESIKQISASGSELTSVDGNLSAALGQTPQSGVTGETNASNLSVTAPVLQGQEIKAAPVQVAQALPADPLEATEEVDADPEAASMDQVTSVSQLSDVSPTDWAYQALQSLVERYGCIVGYPDGTYRGNRSLSRFEFAAGVNACLDQINRLIASAVADAVTREDLQVLNKLQEEFAVEIAALRGRVDTLEARTAELEANQFSTTTKLEGEVVLASGDAIGDSAYENDDYTESFMSHRTRLLFKTSFSGQDALRIRLQAGNTPNLRETTGTNMTRIGSEADTDNNVELNQAWYSFPAGKAKFYVGAVGLVSDDILPTLNPMDNSGAGSLSRFGQRNPIYRGPDGAGAGLSYAFNKNASFQLAYLASDSQAGNPSSGNGIFSGSYGALAQLTLVSKNFDFGLTYAHRFFTSDNVNVSGGTGSLNASKPFGDNSTVSDNVGAQVNWKISPKFNIGGWFGYTWAEQCKNGDDSATLINGALTMTFPDLGKKGNMGGLIVGVPPKVTSNDNSAREDDGTSLHIEAFYRYQVNDFIGITPGLYVITNPDHNDGNETIWVGILRTQYRF